MAGLYIHIPFCKQACYYCNFHFSTLQANKNDFIAALLKEISLQKEYLGEERVESIYFGGGTPSLLDPNEIDLIFEQLFKTFQIEGDAEITLEANPDDIHLSRLASWRESGINRLSMGIQSFYEEDLRWMNRAHNVKQALDCIVLAREAGFSNFNIDLIYGSPTTSDDHWNKNLEKAISLGIPHLSCYALTVEPRTALKKMIAAKQVHDVNPDDQARQFLLLMELMQGSGYEHYEISNFSRKGSRSRHNSSYWQGKKYLGLGPSAHSYNGISRQWNVANNSLYIQALNKSQLVFELEHLTPVQQLNERIMTALRTSEGIPLEEIGAKYGQEISARILTNAKDYLKNNKMEIEGQAMRLTKEGKLLADGIAAHLFFEESDAGLIRVDDSFPHPVP